jgi:hypothetical protein
MVKRCPRHDPKALREYETEMALDWERTVRLFGIVIVSSAALLAVALVVR